MTVTRWSPFEEALSLRDAMHRLLEDSFVRPAGVSGNGGLSPALDLYETNDSFQVEVVVPGMRVEDLDITLRDNLLTISGEVKQEQQSKDRRYHRSERHYGRFSRSISFPAGVKADEVSATYENGILKVEIPKAEEIKPRKIAVQTGGERTIEAGR